MATETETVLKNTYYGPAAQKTGAGTTAIDDQTQGSLQCIVAQQCEIRTGETRGDATLVERYKGPHTALRNWPTEIFLVDIKRDTALGKVKSEIVSRFNVPDAPNDLWGNPQDWIISSCVCTQTSAGDHSIVTVTYRASAAYYTVMNVPQNVDSEEQWSLAWMPYTVNPVAFAKNTDASGAYDAKYLMDKDAKDVQEDQQDRQHFAWRTNIENFRNSKVGDKSKYTWQESKGGNLKKLYYSEQAIVSKLNRGESAIYHYPVVTHRSVSQKAVTLDYKYTNSDYPKRYNNQNIDFYVESLPNDCPFNDYYVGLTGQYPKWKWLKIDDSVEMSKVGGVTRWVQTTKWQGMPNPDENFYGSVAFDHANLEGCRWIVGEL